jgi:hypothetical protein
MIIANNSGIAILVLSFGVAIGIGELLGITEEGPQMIIAGPLVAICDLGYRRIRPKGHWLRHHAGGS